MSRQWYAPASPTDALDVITDVTFILEFFRDVFGQDTLDSFELTDSGRTGACLLLRVVVDALDASDTVLRSYVHSIKGGKENAND